MKTRILNNSGFTLVEVMITLTVVAIVLGVIANFSISALNQSSAETARAELLGESHIAMDRIINDIRLSGGAETTNRWSDINNPSGEYAWSSSSSTLVLATAVIDTSSNVIFADASRYISEKNNSIYSVNGGTLYRRTLASPVANNSTKTSCPAAISTSACPQDRALMRNVSNFSIKYYNGDGSEVTPTDARSVELQVSNSIRKFNRDINTSYTTRAVFRND